MKRTELILSFISLGGLIGQILLLPASKEIVTVSFTFFSIFYFFFTMPYFLGIPLKKVFSKFSYLEISIMRIIGTVFLGFVLASIMIGIMFKLLVLPGAYEMLSIGTIGIPLFGIVIIIKFYGNKKNKLNRLTIKRAIPIFALGYLIQLFPSNLQIQVFYRDNPDFVELYNAHYRHPENKKLRKEVYEALDEMDRDK